MESAEQRSTCRMTTNSSWESEFGPSLVSLRSAGGHRWSQAALFELRYHRHVFELRRVVVKCLDQPERLLPLRAVEQLHLIGQALSLVNGLWRGAYDYIFEYDVCYIIQVWW